MLRPRNITFYKMMLAGYLSVNAYRALKPRKHFEELNKAECSGFEPKIREELNRILDDEYLMAYLYCLECLENTVDIEWDNICSILDMCMCDLSTEDKYTINKNIGKRLFALDYVFCTDEYFKELNFITVANYSSLNETRKRFRVLYKQYIETGILRGQMSASQTPSKTYYDNLPDNTFFVDEPFGEYSIVSGKGFDYNNTFVIDDDALGLKNREYRKYVLYLYSLNKEQFDKFRTFLISAISKCSARLNNSINAVGYRCFLINFLFADDNKYYQIRNFGKKSLFEFNQVKPRIIEYVIDNYNHFNSGDIEELIDEENTYMDTESQTLKEIIGEVPYAWLISQLKTFMSKVSIRTQNGINKYKGDFIEDFVYKSNDVKKLKNIGRKSEIECNLIIAKLREIVYDLTNHETSEELLFWLNKSTVYSELLDEYCHDYYRNHARLPMFHILSNCFTYYLKKDRSINILNSVISIFSNGERNSLENVANDNNLTRERIRQICENTIKRISERRMSGYSNIPMYHNILKQEDWAYVTQILSECNFWKKDDLYDIAQREDCLLSRDIVLTVLAAIYSSQYEIIGKVPLSLRPQNNEWNNSYFISKSLTDCFDFYKMIEIVKDYENTHTMELTLSCQELLLDTFYSAWKVFDYSVVNELEQVVSKILVDELGMIPDLNYKFTLVGKKEETTADVLYGLLKEFGNPLSIDSLFEKIESIHPNKYKSANSLRTIIYKDPRLCLLGVNNLVALNEWEHIRTGSIRDIIVSYMAEHDVPLHIKDIVAHVQQYRNTTERSISSTMCSGEQFVRFSGGYYGLADKDYSNWSILSDSELYARNRIIDFENFLLKKQHFPFCPSDDKEEVSLYQWWRKMLRQSDISETLRDEIARIEQIYSELPHNKTDFLWICNCTKYKEFVQTYGRRPSQRNPIEKDLVNWFTKAMNDAYEGKLSLIRQTALVELCKSL